MFTGLIAEMGIVRDFARSGGLYRLEVGSNVIFEDAVTGDSVSINGACLTLTGKKPGVLCFDVMEETVRRTSLSSLGAGDKVNMEGALKAGKALGGHFVLGHVDCVGTIRRIEDSRGEHVLEIGFPQEFNHLVVEKGSIALDGVSLTVGEAGRGSLRVYIIPHTLKMTNLGARRERDKVNIEFDIIGKYLSRFRSLDKTSGVTEQFLKQMGF